MRSCEHKNVLFGSMKYGNLLTGCNLLAFKDRLCSLKLVMPMADVSSCHLAINIVHYLFAGFD
jgi:hypothetical protein